MNAKPVYDSGYLRVYPKSAGDFGFCSFSGESYEDDKHLKDLESEILEHIRLGRSGGVQIIYDTWICSVCNEEYPTKREADNCCSPTSAGSATKEGQK